jgi:acetyltransferase
MRIEKITEREGRKLLPDLVELLRNTVNNGASVGFIPPLEVETAQLYWLDTFKEIDKGERVLLVSHTDNRLTGSAQLALATKQNGLHRAEVQKVIVHRDFRRRGIGRRLMDSLESAARDLGRTLLVLDTEEGSAGEQLYTDCGYTRVGLIPKYALAANGEFISTVLFYKLI